MPDKTPQITTLPPKRGQHAGKEDESRYWFARHSKSIIFLVLMLAIVGVYEAFSIPIAVFPTTNFPRIIIGVDNGVMPIDQMEVTITRRSKRRSTAFRPGRRALDHEPRVGGSGFILQLERGHGGDAASR
jgi:hypothetical protein